MQWHGPDSVEGGGGGVWTPTPVPTALDCRTVWSLRKQMSPFANSK